MNVYDFDKTIYKNDSTSDFYMFLLRRHPSLLCELPRQFRELIRYKSGKLTKTRFKERFYAAFSLIEDIDGEVRLFWDAHEKNINDWYLKSREPDDVIISASPAFLLGEIAKRLGVERLIASEVDRKSGRTTGENCYGEEKVKRFYREFPDGKIDIFCSDSKSDLPLARLAAKPYLVKKRKIVFWRVE